jgi:hypothetical protein
MAEADFPTAGNAHNKFRKLYCHITRKKWMVVAAAAIHLMMP